MSDLKPFGELTSSEQADWMTSDPDAYFAAANAWAREVAEREYERAIRRRRAEDRERVLRPFRRLWAAATKTFRGLRRADK